MILYNKYFEIIGADESTLELIGFNSIEEMKKNKKNISIRPIETEKPIDKKRVSQNHKK